jgi:hypothetical protein
VRQEVDKHTAKRLKSDLAIRTAKCSLTQHASPATGLCEACVTM